MSTAVTNARLRPSQFRPNDHVETGLGSFTVMGITFVRGGVRVDDTNGNSRVLNGRCKFAVTRPLPVTHRVSIGTPFGTEVRTFTSREDAENFRASFRDSGLFPRIEAV